MVVEATVWARTVMFTLSVHLSSTVVLCKILQPPYQSTSTFYLRGEWCFQEQRQDKEAPKHPYSSDEIAKDFISFSVYTEY